MPFSPPFHFPPLYTVGSTAARVVLISSDTTPEARALLAEVFTKVVEVPVIDVKVPLKNKQDKKAVVKHDWLGKSFTKLHALNLTEFQKIVLLDADIICVSNPDNIFNVNGPAGIFTSLLRPSDAAMHGQIVTPKIFTQAYRDNGIRGCTYVLKPSTNDFERAINMITVKPKVIQYVPKNEGIASLLGKNDSAFALLGDEDEEEEESAAPVKAAPAPARPTEVAPECYDEEALKAFEDMVVKYPFTVYKSAAAPLGFAYGDKGKSLMGPDEMLIADMYKSSWRHIHARYGHPSWRKNEASPQGSVFMHYTTDCPWTRTQDWPDYEAWDAVAMNLMKTSSSMRDFLVKYVPALVEKEARGSPAAINPPAVAPTKKNVKTTPPVAVIPFDSKRDAVKVVPNVAPSTRGWGNVAVVKAIPIEESAKQEKKNFDAAVAAKKSAVEADAAKPIWGAKK